MSKVMSNQRTSACITLLIALGVSAPARAQLDTPSCRALFERADANHDEVLSAAEINLFEELVATLRGRDNVGWRDFETECRSWGPIRFDLQTNINSIESIRL
jgi:hypothetical protein